MTLSQIDNGGYYLFMKAIIYINSCTSEYRTTSLILSTLCSPLDLDILFSPLDLEILFSPPGP